MAHFDFCHAHSLSLRLSIVPLSLSPSLILSFLHTHVTQAKQQSHRGKNGSELKQFHKMRTGVDKHNVSPMSGWKTSVDLPLAVLWGKDVSKLCK